MAELSLPLCRWRRPSPILGRQQCTSSLVRAGPFGVMNHACWMCRVADHRDPDAAAPFVAEAGTVRHLLYHLWPWGARWRWNVEQLRRRISLFNGRRLVSVAIDQATAQVDEVDAALQGMDCELIEQKNDPHLREMVSYPHLLQLLSNYRGAGDCHFYAHSKGTSSGEQWDGVQAWAEAMYSTLLDYWPAVLVALKRYAAVGILRKRWKLTGHPGSVWHYSGTFRWVRNVDLYSRDWSIHSYDWASPETHPGSMFSLNESCCLWGESSNPTCDFYRAAAWRGWAGRERDAWYAAHKADFLPARGSVEGEIVPPAQS